MDWQLNPLWVNHGMPQDVAVAAALEHIRHARRPGRLVLTGGDSVSIAALAVEAVSSGWQLAFPAGTADIDRWPDTSYTLRILADSHRSFMDHGCMPQREGPWDVAMSTSGTTRRARTFAFTRDQLSGICRLYDELYGLGAHADIVTALPAAHNFAFVAGVCAAAATGTGMFFATTHTDVVAWLAQHPNDRRVIVLANPVLLEQEGIEQTAKPGMLIDSGAAPVSRPHVLSLRDRGADIREGYGTTETLSLTHFDDEGTAASAGSVGRPVRDVQCRLTNGHVVQVRSPYTGTELDAHLRPAAATTPSWMTTGDVGTIDSQQRLRLLGRTGDQPISGLWPRDILDALGAILGARTASISPHCDWLGIQLLNPVPEGVQQCLVDLAASLTGLPPQAIRVSSSAQALTYSLKLPRLPDSPPEP